MTQQNSFENNIICGNCGTHFDFNRNPAGCPLCGFGKDHILNTKKQITLPMNQKDETLQRLFDIPSDIELQSGNVIIDDETKTWGSWLMFNDFFAPKLITRVLAWKLHEEETETILLSSLMSDVIKTIEESGLSKMKGFPNLNKDPKGERLVNHFLRTFTKMGLTFVKPLNPDVKDIWKENWEKIRVTLSIKGLEFAQMKNPVFDEQKTEQILSKEEKKWIIDYLKEIDEVGYREYSILKEVYNFIKEGNNGNKDLWNWFINNEKFRNYIPERSKRAREDPEIFQKQMENYARSFSTAKISLLRELGVINNKRNDYSITGGFE